MLETIDGSNLMRIGVYHYDLGEIERLRSKTQFKMLAIERKM